MHRTPRCVSPIFAGLSLAFAMGLVGPSLAAQDDGDAPKVVQVDGKIRFSVDPEVGMPLVEFIELAEKIAGRTIIYSPQEVAVPNANIQLVGDVVLERGPEDFYRFFQTMLYVKGFACLPRSVGGEELIEIVSMQGPRRSEVGSSARFVPVEEIDAYREQTGVQVLTLVTLEHINAQRAATATRPFFAQNSGPSGGLILGNLGDDRSMLLQGFGPQVYGAVQLLKLSDTPRPDPERETRVFRLEHASAAELKATIDAANEAELRSMQQQVAQQGLSMLNEAPLTLVAHESLNALVITGSERAVARALELVVALDVSLDEGTNEVAVVALENCVAADIAASVQSMFATPQPAPGPGARGAGMQPTFGQVTVASDARTNSVILSGDRASLSRARELVRAMDRTPARAARAAELEVDEDRVEFSIPAGGELPMVEFIRIAQYVTGRVMTYRKADVTGDHLAVSLAGTVRTSRDGFFEFFRTMLAARGLVVESLGGDGIEMQQIRPQGDGD